LRFNEHLESMVRLWPCGEDGVASFDRIRHRHHDADVFLYAFDLIELDGEDLRRSAPRTQGHARFHARALGADRSTVQ
jgi:hypothetical protein